jgi:hypothetical protein
MAQYHFGAGTLIGTPLTNYAGTAVTLPTPVTFGALQDCSIDLSGDVKELYGQNQFPLAVGRGKCKIVGKAKMAQLNGTLINNLFFGQTMTASAQTNFTDQTGTAIPTTPFQIVPVTTYATALAVTGSAAAWSADLGVIMNGLPMKRVSGTPNAGEYAVSAGTYTFASADNVSGYTAYINFAYTATSTSAQLSTVTNVLMGQAPTFQADFTTVYNGKYLTLTLFSCVSTKLSFATKLDDFMVPEFDFSAFANSANQVLRWSATDR